MYLTYRIIIEPDTKGFHGYVPALPGCHTWGKTLQETKKHLEEAMFLYIETLQNDGKKLPEDSSFESFATIEVAAQEPIRRRSKSYA